MPRTPYPVWRLYPSSKSPEAWVDELVSVVRSVQGQIDSNQLHLESNAVLSVLAPGLREAGYQVEAQGKPIRRTVLFGDNGKPVKSFDVDAIREHDGVAIEVEAGGSDYGNKALFDAIKMSLIDGVSRGAILMPQRYATARKTWGAPYDKGQRDLEALLAHQARVRLPLEGILLVGY